MCVFHVLHSSRRSELSKTLDRHWHAEGWDACPLPRYISEVLGHNVDGSVCDVPGQTRESIAVHSIKGRVPCLFTLSPEVWHIKNLKWPKFYERSVKWMFPDCSSTGPHLQRHMASFLWSHCSNNLLTRMYWHEISTGLQYIVNSELFHLLMRGFLCVLICLFYGF